MRNFTLSVGVFLVVVLISVSAGYKWEYVDPNYKSQSEQYRRSPSQSLRPSSLPRQYQPSQSHQYRQPTEAQQYRPSVPQHYRAPAETQQYHPAAPQHYRTPAETQQYHPPAPQHYRPPSYSSPHQQSQFNQPQSHSQPFRPPSREFQLPRRTHAQNEDYGDDSGEPISHHQNQGHQQGSGGQSSGLGSRSGDKQRCRYNHSEVRCKDPSEREGVYCCARGETCCAAGCC